MDASAQHLDGPLNQTDYQLTARFVTERTLEGTAHIRWVHQSAVPTREIWWHLYLNAFANHDSLFYRTLAAQGHRGHPPGRAGSITVHSIEWVGHAGDLRARSTIGTADNPGDQTEMHTLLPEEIQPNTVVELNVRFTSVLPDAFARTGCGGGFCFVGQWFPKLAVLERDGQWTHFALHANSEFYADFGRYELSVDTPRSMQQWGPGVVTEMPAVDSSRVCRRYELEPAHDLSFAVSSSLMQQRSINVQASAGPLRVTIVYPQSDSASAERALAVISRAVSSLERRFGQYPYHSLMVVLPPHAAEGTGGMEYPGLITIDSQPGLPSFVREVEYVTVHELAHQWFYGLLASDEHAHPFLDEGLTEYATGIVLDELYGSPAFFKLFHTGLDFWSIQGGFAGSEPSADPLAQGASQFHSFSHYSNIVYRRTAAALHSVEQDDPAAVRDWLHAYSGRYAGRHPTPSDLLTLLDRSSVAPQNRLLLRTLITTGGRVDLRVAALDPQQVTLVRDGLLQPTVDVELVPLSGPPRRIRWISTESPKSIQGAYQTVRIDPDRHWALDDNRANNDRSLSSRGTTPSLFRLGAWAALLLRWIGP